MTEIESEITQMKNEQALPRQNGELLFNEPWEARAFALAVALNQSGRYPWRDFSAELAAQTATAQALGQASSYYERWLVSLEEVLNGKGLINPEELAERMDQIAAADDHGHDHDH